MKVLFISRATLYKGFGGDTVQIEETAKALRSLQVDVTIALCNNTAIDYSQYDLIHFFNITRPADIIYHINKSKLPFVVSPIYVEYPEGSFSNAKGVKQKLFAIAGRYGREYIKCIGRSMMNGEKIISGKYVLWGHKKSIAYILKKCSCLLPNSEKEYKRLGHDFKEAGHYAVIPNAVDTGLFCIDEDQIRHKKENSIACLARFEPHKNQLNIIRALNGSPYQVTFAGSIAPNHQQYYQQCVAEAGSNFKFMGFLSQESCVALLRQSKVHILASWFETTGLSSLEAAACGCNIVIAIWGDAGEYFEDKAFYCSPDDAESILSAVNEAMEAVPDKDLIKTIADNYNWKITAQKTREVYKQVLNK